MLCREEIKTMQQEQSCHTGRECSTRVGNLFEIEKVNDCSLSMTSSKTAIYTLPTLKEVAVCANGKARKFVRVRSVKEPLYIESSTAPRLETLKSISWSRDCKK